ncbi:MAG: LamG-like jellyroll fold domain-containing protein [Limisphaerales bacterium]
MIPSPTPLHRRLAALAVWAGSAALLHGQINIPPQAALPSSVLDRTKPGFSVRVHQATTSAGVLLNSNARTEAQLAGLLPNPATGVPYANIADPATSGPDGRYNEENIISYAAGAFPGIPGTEGAIENIALEAVTYVELAPGTYSMVVNSDDGFRLTTGNVADRLQEFLVGQFDGGRGAGDTVMNFSITQAGVYPFRLIYQQGGGGYSVDWFTADPNDAASRVHLNGSGGVAAYRAINTPVSPQPAITGLYPVNGQTGVSPSTPFTMLVDDGATAIETNSIVVLRNGTNVTAQTAITRSGGRTTIRYSSTNLPPSLAQIEFKVTFADKSAPPVTREAVARYTIAPYANFNLPTPLFLETFDSTAEGGLPAGWTATSPITPIGEEDLDNPNSDSYLNWVVISRDRVQALGSAGRWDAARRLNFPEAYINGQRITGLISTNFAYHESDVRGGSQYSVLLSPTYNLTGRSNLFLVYHSIYEQNQDNIASVEYSIDNGTTWLPVVYMLDGPDIVLKTDGTPDAVATFTKENGDTAVYTDPLTGEEVGRAYGPFIGAATNTWPNLGPFIEARLNDDPFESKRIERYRLPQADGRSLVKLRFAQAGTGSWYFGVDNVGLYEITVIDPPNITKQPASATRLVGGSVTFEGGASGQQLAFQWYKDGTNAIPGATNATYTITGLTRAGAGSYSFTVTNPGGSAASSAATLAVLDAPEDASSLRNGLGVYLTFEGNYNDASGNNRNGAAVGAPVLTNTAKVGKGAVRVSSLRSATTYNYVTLGSNADLPFGVSSNFTVAFWVRVERLAGDPSFVANKNWGSGGNTGWTIGSQGDGRIEWNYKRSAPSRKDLDLTSRGNLLNNGQWNHVVVVWNIAGDAVTYWNGEKVDVRAIGPADGDIADAALALNLGQDGTGQYTDGDWDGLLDDVAVWDRSLTDDEVLTLFGYGSFGDSFLAGPTTDGLAVHLKFDGDFADASGNGNGGTAVGAPTFAAGRAGQAANLVTRKPQGTFNYVTLGNGPKVRFGDSTNFSVAFWAKMNDWASDPAFIANKDWGSGGNIGWVIATDGDGRLQWNYRRDGGPARRDFDSVGGLFSDKQWHHVLVTFDINGQAATYLDGVEIPLDRNNAAARKDITPGTGVLLDPTRALNIGQDGTGQYSDSDLFDALMDDVGIWTRVVSGREAAVIYSRGLRGEDLTGESGSGGQPAIAFSTTGGQLTLNWTGDGYTLEEKTALGVAGGWNPTPGAGANSATVSTTGSTKYFRLRK